MKFAGNAYPLYVSIRLVATSLAMCLIILPWSAQGIEAQGSQAAQKKVAAGAAETSLPQVEKLLDSARQALSSGNVGDAHNAIDQALDLLAKSAGDHSLQMASCYESLGRTQVSEGLTGLAEESLKKALDLREAKLGLHAPLVMQSYAEYADVLEQLGRKEEANKLREKAKAASATPATKAAASKPAAKSSAAKAPSAFDRFVEAAHQADEQSQKEEAENNWTSAVEEAEKTGSKDRLAYALVHLGDHLRKRPLECSSLYRRGIQVREQNSATTDLGMARNLERVGMMQVIDNDHVS